MTVEPLKDIELKAGKGADTDTSLLTKGKQYFVYAVQKRPGGKQYYFVFEDGQQRHLQPEPYPASNFKVVDPKLPDDWVSASEGKILKRVNTTFQEWAEDFSGF